LNGIFSIKNPDIIPIYNDIQKLLNEFDSVSFTHIPRSENSVADSEANRAIDILIKKTPG
jgi:probable phosphoglycerate mutase